MKHLLNGVAIAAVLALATSAFAQNAPMTPTTPPKPAAAAPKPAAPKPAPAPKMAGPKPAKHHVMSKDDRMTEQLNAQELARITGGGSAPPPGGMAPPPGGGAPPPGGGMAPPPPQR